MPGHRCHWPAAAGTPGCRAPRPCQKNSARPIACRGCADCAGPVPAHRSEEHTSELQSLMRISYAVFCLKKKNIHLHSIRNQKVFPYKMKKLTIATLEQYFI